MLIGLPQWLMNIKFWLLELRYDLDAQFHGEHDGIVCFSWKLIFDDLHFTWLSWVVTGQARQFESDSDC